MTSSHSTTVPVLVPYAFSSYTKTIKALTVLLSPITSSSFNLASITLSQSLMAWLISFIPLQLLQLCTSPLFFKIGITTLLLHSLGILSISKIGLVRMSIALALRHVHNSTGMPTGISTLHPFHRCPLSPYQCCVIADLQTALQPPSSLSHILHSSGPQSTLVQHVKVSKYCNFYFKLKSFNPVSVS